MKSTLIYEQAQLEQFENAIIQGHLSKDQIQFMIENNQLSDKQLEIVQELAPVIGGLKNLASKAYSGAQNLVNKGKEAYNQGVEQQKIKNAQQQQVKQWKNIEATITKSQLFEKLEAFRKMFPQDRYMNDITTYVNRAFLEMQNHLAKNYPYMNHLNDENYVSMEDERTQQENQRNQAQSSSI